MTELLSLLRREMRKRGLSDEIRPASEADLRAAQTVLGLALPATYVAFAREIGSTSWPIQVFGIEQLQRGGRFGQPPWFVAFATDGAGNDWGWDTRDAAEEHPVMFWDHEEPPTEDALAKRSATGTFADWLAGRLDDALGEEDDDRTQEIWATIRKELARHADGAFPYTPALEDVQAVEARLGVTLPEDYVTFTTVIGSTSWPVRIVDGQDVEGLTRELRAAHPSLRDAVGFGQDLDGTPLAFRGPTVISPTSALAKSFLSFLMARINEANARDHREAPTPSEVAGRASRRPESGADPAYVWAPPALTDPRARDLFHACANAKSYAVEPTPDGRRQVVIDGFEGGRRRSFVDAATWTEVELHLSNAKTTRREG